MARYEYIVQVTQHDAIHLNLCRTRQQLRWTTSGNQADFYSRSKFGYAWAPTSAGTNWYKYYNDWDGSAQNIDGGRTVISTNKAKYWNKDFHDPNKITEVFHKLTLEGYYTGGAYYYKTVERTGEYASTLHSHTKITGPRTF